jgi:TRAP-type C4-dicarboxylate transport system permease small subunit
MKYLIGMMERIGGFFLFVIMCLITATAVTRYLFNWPIPDADSLSRLLLSVVVFWGIAAACLRSEHIQLDLIVDALPARIGAFVLKASFAVTLLALVFLTYAAFGRILDIRSTGETTYDLGIRLWPFYGIAFLGIVAAVFAQFYVLLYGAIPADETSPTDKMQD